ncbi:MAG: glycosyltransferase [Erythrobacter sp.]
MDRFSFTVIIPAHNEANVILRCLSEIFDQTPQRIEPEVIVAANGCEDETAAIVREHYPDVIVLELKEGSKTQAMNAAMERATEFPRIFLDADVRCDFRSLYALAAALKDGDLWAGVPAVRMDVSQSNWFVRAYYRVWSKQPFAKMALGGSGCFGLSQKALERIGPFPGIIADDFWALSRFSAEERGVIAETQDGSPVFSQVTPPRAAFEQIRVEARRRAGNDQVKNAHWNAELELMKRHSLLRSAFTSGASLLDILVFLVMKFLSALLAKWRKWRGTETVWVKDLSSRQAQAHPSRARR